MAATKKAPKHRHPLNTSHREAKVHVRKNGPTSRVDDTKTQRWSVEEQARFAEAQRADLLAIATHDLRNPLGVVLVTSTMLARELTAPNQLEQVAAIRRAATEMTQVIEDLVDAANIDRGSLELMPDVLAPMDVIEQAASVARTQRGERAIVIETRIDPSLPELYVDRTRLLQVFSRLVGNALRFMPKTGTITLECAMEGNTVCFSVVDSGPVVPESQRPYAFLRRPPIGRRACRGTGLGMFVVKGIVEAHGGTVELTSDVEHGNRVSFTLPVERATENVEV